MFEASGVSISRAIASVFRWRGAEIFEVHKYQKRWSGKNGCLKQALSVQESFIK